jgi:hypothetical protein
MLYPLGGREAHRSVCTYLLDQFALAANLSGLEDCVPSGSHAGVQLVRVRHVLLHAFCSRHEHARVALHEECFQILG